MLDDIPGFRDPFILKLRLFQRLFEGLVAGIGDRIPVCIASKEVVGLFSFVPTDRQPSRRSLQSTRNDLSTVPCRSMPSIDHRPTDQDGPSELLWRLLHCSSNNLIRGSTHPPGRRHDGPLRTAVVGHACFRGWTGEPARDSRVADRTSTRADGLADHSAEVGNGIACRSDPGSVGRA